MPQYKIAPDPPLWVLPLNLQRRKGTKTALPAARFSNYWIGIEIHILDYCTGLRSIYKQVENFGQDLSFKSPVTLWCHKSSKTSQEKLPVTPQNPHHPVGNRFKKVKRFLFCFVKRFLFYLANCTSHQLHPVHSSSLKDARDPAEGGSTWTA